MENSSSLLFDLIGTQPIGDVRNSGGAEYSKFVFFYFVKNHSKNITISVLFINTRRVDEDITSFLTSHPLIHVFYINAYSEINSFFSVHKFTTIFCGLNVNQYTNKTKIPDKTRFVLTEHGLRRIETKIDKVFFESEKFSFKLFAKFLLCSLSRKLYQKIAIKTRKEQFLISKKIDIVTVSEHSKTSIELFYPFLANHITVAYSPLSIKPFQNTTINDIEKFGLTNKKYILLINGNRGEKNCLRGVSAVDSLLTSKLSCMQGIKTIVVGTTDKKVFTKRIRNKTSFVFIGYVNKSTLESLYKFAHLFLYPTINEGFGYPPLEAMKYGTIVATSAVSSIPEVCQNAVLYFNPYDVDEIKNRIVQSFDNVFVSSILQNEPKVLNSVSKKQTDGLHLLVKKLEE